MGLDNSTLKELLDDLDLEDVVDLDRLGLCRYCGEELSIHKEYPTGKGFPPIVYYICNNENCEEEYDE